MLFQVTKVRCIASNNFIYNYINFSRGFILLLIAMVLSSFYCSAPVSWAASYSLLDRLYGI